MPALNPATDQTPPVQRLSVLGATGSVGTSTLALVDETPGAFDVVALSAHGNVARLAELARKHHAQVAVIADPAQYEALREALAGSDCEAAAGPQALVEAAQRPVDCLLGAIMGAAGLQATLAAAGHAKRIALANKECLVSAGDVFMAEVARHGTELLPVDSEHSAAFQALCGDDHAGVERIVLTASGGPFRTASLATLEQAGPAQALKHPNWTMGRKITIDSATLMNKGLELIEAYHLFPVEKEQLSAIVHPQSIVHCLVEYADGSVLAQLASPDMRTPIAYALSYPRRMATTCPRLDLLSIGALTFEPVDEARFPAIRLAREALQAGGSAPAVLNAANEIAVEAFLDERLKFLEIARLVEQVLEGADNDLIRPLHTLADVYEVDERARAVARGRLAQFG
ncbi:MAG: 1-deoxy-D-xylulose-5-phosphate reductoisomerase [Pseudomonadota bacterium]